MADLLRFSVPGKPEYVGVVRLAISSAANTCGFDVEDIDDIKVAVSEVCTHIFCNGDSDVTYEVSCEIGEDGITISIDDLKEEDEEAEQMHQCLGLPVSTGFMPEMFDPSTCMFMLRTLMDQVDIFSDSDDECMLIRMIKHL